MLGVSCNDKDRDKNLVHLKRDWSYHAGDFPQSNRDRLLWFTKKSGQWESISKHLN
jgi:hypothetical protein